MRHQDAKMMADEWNKQHPNGTLYSIGEIPTIYRTTKKATVSGEVGNYCQAVIGNVSLEFVRAIDDEVYHPLQPTLDRIAHALEVIAAAMTSIEGTVSNDSTRSITGPLAGKGYDVTVERIKAGGNY
jgi:hypothetical protein